MLSHISDEELKAELARRTAEAKAAEKPQQISNPDLTNLRRNCQEYIDALDRNGYVDEDWDNYIYEEAMKAIFGKDVFEWINKQLR